MTVTVMGTFLLQALLKMAEFLIYHLLTALLLFSGVRSSSASSHQPRLTTTTWAEPLDGNLKTSKCMETHDTPRNILKHMKTLGNTLKHLKITCIDLKPERPSSFCADGRLRLFHFSSSFFWIASSLSSLNDFSFPANGPDEFEIQYPQLLAPGRGSPSLSLGLFSP